MLKQIIRAAAAFALLGSASLASAESIVLESDKTVMLNLADRPGTVVVGNPSIADVSINGSAVFLHGRAYGNTNIIILGIQGQQLATFDVEVKTAQTGAITMYTVRPSIVPDQTIRVSYACSPTCEPSLQIGDFEGQYKLVSEATKVKNEIATGSKTAEAEAPSAAQ